MSEATEAFVKDLLHATVVVRRLLDHPDVGVSGMTTYNLSAAHQHMRDAVDSVEAWTPQPLPPIA